MALRWQLMTVATCLSLIGIVGGCTPASNSPVDEEKDPYVSQGRNREAAYDYAGAIESYHRALDLNPRNSVAHERLGLLYEREDRDPAAAIYHLQQYLRLRPNSEIATVIRQRILGCKQELAKEVALGPVSGEMKHQLDELIHKNQQLAEETQRLSDENRKLRELIVRLQGGSAPASASPGPSPSPYAYAPPRQPTRTPAPEPAPTGTTHTVQKGDTYYSIAKRYGVTLTALQAANPGVDPSRLQIGQRLRVPSR